MRNDTQQPTVLILDHSLSAGGAELALARVLEAGLANPTTLRVPVGKKDDQDAFSRLVEGESLKIRRAGAAPRPGATRSGGFAAAVTAAGTVLAALRLRMSSDFRSSPIIYANTSRSALTAAISCALAPRKTLVVHLRDAVDVDGLGTVGFRAARGVTLRRADGVIGNSAYTLATAKAARPDAPWASEVIPSAAGLTREGVGEPADVVSKVGMVARLDPWKGQAEAISAFAQSGLSGRGVTLHLAGSAQFGHDEYEGRIRRLVTDLGIEECVFFHGQVQDVLPFIDDMDILVHYSLKPEPLGQNVLQYLSRGKPVIAAAEGGPAQWITDGENGVLARPRDVSALATAMKTVADDGAFRRMIAEGARTVDGLLTDAEVAQRLDDFFELVHKAKWSRHG